MRAPTTTFALIALTALTTLTAPATAQVTSSDIIVAENTKTQSTGLVLVNPVTRKSRPVGGVTSGGFSLVAVNQMNPTDLFGSSLHPCAGFMPALDQFQMSGDKITKTTLGCVDFGRFGLLARMHGFRGEILFTIKSTGQSGGVYMRPVGANKSAFVHQMTDATNLAVIGDKIYVSAKNQIVEIDLTTTTKKVRTLKLILDKNAPKGSALPANIAAMCTFGHEAAADTLAVLDDKGVLYFVKPNVLGPAHNVTTANKPGIAKPVAIKWCPKVALSLVVATGKDVFDALQYSLSQGKPLYTSTSTITDIAYDAGGVRFFGAGCKGSNGRIPSMVFGGVPSIGNTSFSIRMENGAANALSRFVLGLSNTRWGSNNLPLSLGFMGATNCDLLASADLMLTVTTNAKGEVVIPSSVPMNSALVGGTIHVQFGIGDKNANAAGLTTSNAATFVIR